MTRYSSNIRGGVACGMSSSDFDPKVLRQGTLVELEHTDDEAIAQKIAMDHIRETGHKNRKGLWTSRYYDELAKAEHRLEMRPNRGRGGRIRVYDTSDTALALRERFTDRSSENEYDFDFDWPDEMQLVGDSLAVAYGSDKWQKKNRRGRRKVDLYKHIAESRNYLFCHPGLIQMDDGTGVVPTIGPLVRWEPDYPPMPDSFAILGLFKEANVQLFTEGSDAEPRLVADAGIMTLTVRHGMLGGSVIPWSQVSSRRDEPFLFVYTANEGIMLIILGDKIDILKDGIVG